MKNKIWQKWLSLILAFALLAGMPSFVLAQEAPPDEPIVMQAVDTEGDPARYDDHIRLNAENRDAPDYYPIPVVEKDICSPWAEFDIFMAQSAYELGDSSTYANFKGDLTSDVFMPVYDKLADAFGTAPDLAIPLGTLTRGEVITALYGVIHGSLAKDDDEATVYFVEQKLIGGRASGDYELDKTCTVEEMLVFSARTYEHIAYILGLDARGFLWEVQGGANKVYLLGSIHMSSGSMYPLSKAIETAFAGSDTLAVEVDITAEAVQDPSYLYEVGLIRFESGQTIKDYLSAETYDLYVKVMKVLEIPQVTYDFMKPWFASMVLQGLLLSGSDMEAQLGIDMYFLHKAYMADKDIVELESMEFQYDMFDSFSLELQEYELLGVVKEIEVMIEDSDEEDSLDNVNEMVFLLHEIVRTGDEEALSMVLGVNDDYVDPLEKEYNDKLLINRNKGMAEKILGFLRGAEAGTYFVVVGAAHMLGRDGLVELLRSQGYTVVRK